jgi:hypothetical protein
MRGANVQFLDGMLPIHTLHRVIMDHFVDGPLKTKRCFKEYGCDDPFHCSYRMSNSCEWWKIRQAIGRTDPVLISQ